MPRERTSQYWDDHAPTFDDEPDHGLRDSVVREAWVLRDGGRLVLIEGRWSTGEGMTGRHLTDVVRPVLPDCEMRPLTDATLWGGPVEDERYMLVARR